MTRYYDKRSRIEKGFEIVKNDKVRQCGEHTFIVEGSNNQNYTVNLYDNTCDCRDQEFNDNALGQYCKHLFAAQIKRNPLLMPI